MAQPMRRDEEASPVRRRTGSEGDTRASERRRRKGEQALERLRAAITLDSADVDRVAALLDVVAEAVATLELDGAPPAAERATWESVGASFEALGELERSNQRRLLEAHASLLERSIVSDLVMAEHLGVDRSRVSQRVAERSLYSFTAAEERCFPRWQLSGGNLVPGLKTVLVAMDPDIHPIAVDRWFTSTHVDLDAAGAPTSPIVWLATGGDAELVASLASDL